MARKRTRRDFLKGVLQLTAGAVAGSSLLSQAACTPTSPSAPTAVPVATTKPAAAPQPTAAAAAAPAKPAAAPATPPLKMGGSAVVAIQAKIPTLDPPITDTKPISASMMHVLRGLFTNGRDLQPVLDLAEGWQVSSDELSWTFKLRKGVKFHDGTPFDAESVKINMERLLDPANKFTRANTLSPMKKFEPLDANTLRITTNRPMGPMLSQLAYFPTMLMSPKAIQTYGKDVGQHPVGAGPFRVTEFVPNERLVVERYADYVGRKAYLDKVTFITVPEYNSRVSMLETGEIQVGVNITPQLVPSIEKNPNLGAIVLPSTRQLYVGINCQRPEFKDPRVRKALNHAVDKQAMLKAILGGVGKLSTSVIPSSMWSHVDGPLYEFDPAKAKALLAEAGWRPGSDGILAKDGAPLKILIQGPDGNYLGDRQSAEAVQAYLKAIGIDAQLKIQEYNTYWSWLHTPEAEKESMLNVYAYGPSNLSIGFVLFNDKAGSAAFVTQFYKNPTYNAIYDKIDSLTDDAKRAQASAEGQKMLWDDAPWIFLYELPYIVGYSKKLGGLQANGSEEFSVAEAGYAS